LIISNNCVSRYRLNKNNQLGGDTALGGVLGSETFRHFHAIAI